MEAAGIVPTIIPKAPKKQLKISYPSGVVVNDGAELTPTQVKDKPNVEVAGDSTKLHTLVMIDPDAPTLRGTGKEVLHWLIVNIPGNDVSKGEIIADYVGSGPPQGSGLHRYIFFVFQQPGRLNVDEARAASNSREGRLQFKLIDFIAKYNLGEALAGNFYNAQFDDYVPILHAQFSK